MEYSLGKSNLLPEPRTYSFSNVYEGMSDPFGNRSKIRTHDQQVSILLTYLYVFPQRSNQIFCWTGIVFIGVFGAANIITTCLQCTLVTAD